MTRNPYTSANESAQRTVTRTNAFDAEVISSPTHTGGDKNKHHVLVRPKFTNSQVMCDFSVNALGDAHAPTEGTWVRVVPHKNGRGTIIGAAYNENEPPDYAPGERIVGHELSDSKVHFEEDGSIRLEHEEGAQVKLAADGSIYIGNQSGGIQLGEGTKGVITDIETDDSGNLVVTRSDTVFVS